MRSDLIIGIVLAAFLHVGIIFSGSIFKSHPKPKKAEEPPPTIELMKMPPLEEDPIPVDDQQEKAEPQEFAPPSQVDAPSLVQLDSFVQKVQPPPPEGLKPNSGIITIPQGKPGGLGKGIEVFDISKLDQKPEPRSQSKPIYPFEMRRAGIAGEVVVEFIVDASGEVKNAFAVRSTQREFESAAVQAVSKWRFKPGRKGGHAVATRMQVPIVFSLNEDN